MKKIILFLIVTMLLISTCLGVAFNDIDNHWAKESIIDSYEKNFVSGYEDGTFRPNNTITRAEFVTILAKLLDSSIIVDIDSYNNIFTYNDLPDSHWCKPFYNKLMYYGYIFSTDYSYTQYKGRDFITNILGHSFNPSEPITREEAVSLIAYFLDDEKLSTTSNIQLSDIESSKLQNYIGKFCKTGIIKGYSDGTFRPHNTITRAEVTKIISDTFQKRKLLKNVTWLNNDSIKNVYTKDLTPEEVFDNALFYENAEEYQYAYQFLSDNYKIINNIYNYKDYMKKTNSHIFSRLNLPEEYEITTKENKDGSITLSFNDINNYSRTIDLISINDKWYINSKLY